PRTDTFYSTLLQQSASQIVVWDWRVVILNTFAVLDAFVCFSRLILSLVAVCIGYCASRQWRSSPRIDRSEKSLDDQFHLLLLAVGLLLILNVLAWPLLYLVLQSYVVEWPGVMCIYGVTRVGTGSVGPSRFLPALLAGLQLSKPFLVFLTGG